MTEPVVPRTSRFAIVAIVCACLFCVPLAPLAGIVLAAVALVQIGKRPGELGGRGLAITALCLGGLTFVMSVGVMAAVVIPNMATMGSRSKTFECRTNLKAMYVAELAYFQEKDTYSTSVLQIGFSPERGNRYVYLASPGPLADRSKPGVEMPMEATGVGVDTFRHGPSAALDADAVLPFVRPGFVGTCPDCHVVLACAGNIDNDDTLDVWSIATVDRPGPDGTVIPRGEPWNHRSDVAE